jgi:hypothetical protein
VRSLLREAWDVVRGVAGVVVGRPSWRESLRILRASVWRGLAERLVGLVVVWAVVGLAVCALAWAWQLTQLATGMRGGLP